MTKRGRVPAKRGTGAVTAGSGQAAGPVGLVRPARFGIVVDGVVPAYLACRIGDRSRAGERDAWSAVAAIALGSFALVFSEVIPVGLLADISGHLGVPVGTGGLMVVVPAVAAVGSLALLGRPARPSALRRQARQIWPARGAGKGRHGRPARPMEQGKLPANTLKSAVRGHSEAAARKELPCPTRL
jgi:hypothetical protein